MWNTITQFLNIQLYRLLAFFLPPQAQALPAHPQLILVFSTTGIGDSLFDSAAIKSLKQGYPTARVVVATHHRRGAMAKHNPFVDEVVPLSKSPWSQLQFLRRFWHQRPDLIVALRVNEEAVPLGYLLNRHAFFGAIERCQRMSFLLSHPILSRGSECHIVEETLKVAEAAGGSKTDYGMIFRVSQEEKETFFQKHPLLKKKSYLVFQVGGGKTLSWRDWPPECCIQAIQWLQAHHPEQQVILTGGHDNKAAAATIAAACPQVLNMVEKTTLEETAVLLSEAKLLISSDTGVMHLGFAIGCPTLALLHYKSPAACYGPLDFSPGHEIIELRKPLRMPNHHEGEMKEISLAQVTAVLERMLGC